MAACELNIELDRPGALYEPGEAIAGTVRVDAWRAVRCDGLTVALEWYTHGRGNRDQGSIQRVELLKGEIPAGTTRYSFELRATAEPRAYHGELLNVGRRVRAVADVPWALDPKAEVDVVVRQDSAPRFRVASPNQGRPDVTGCFPGFALLAVVSAVAGVVGGSLGPSTLLGVGLLGGILSFFGALATFRKWAARRRTGAVKVALRQGGPGGYREVADPAALQCEVLLGASPRGLDSLRAELVVQERVIKGSGSNRRTFTERLYSYAAELEGTDGRRFTAELRLPDPGEVPLPFSSTSNHLEWFVDVVVDIEAWPDWKDRFELEVSPAP